MGIDLNAPDAILRDSFTIQMISFSTVLDWMKLWVCSAFFYNFLFIYWSMISFVLRIQIVIDLYTIIDKALYW